MKDNKVDISSTHRNNKMLINNEVLVQYKKVRGH